MSSSFLNNIITCSDLVMSESKTRWTVVFSPHGSYQPRRVLLIHKVAMVPGGYWTISLPELPPLLLFSLRFALLTPAQLIHQALHFPDIILNQQNYLLIHYLIRNFDPHSYDHPPSIQTCLVAHTPTSIQEYQPSLSA